MLSGAHVCATPQLETAMLGTPGLLQEESRCEFPGETMHIEMAGPFSLWAESALPLQHESFWIDPAAA